MAKRPKTKKDTDAESTQPERKKVAAEKTPYPIWAKMLVSCVLTGWIAFAGLFTYFLFGCVQLLKEATDPVIIAREAKRIVQFADPLPEGFKYTFTGIPLNYNLMTMAYKPDGTVFVIGTKSKSELGSKDARKIVENPKDFGLPNVYGEMKLEQKGSIDVAGENLEYVSGSSTNQDHSIGCFIGCAMLKNDSALIIYAVTTRENTDGAQSAHKDTFNMEATKKLLSAIKGF